MPTKSAIFVSIIPMIPTGASLADALKSYKDELGFAVLSAGFHFVLAF
jgi:hypothetical protein